MPFFKFVGDPRALGKERLTGHGPERIVVAGVTFVKNVVTEIEDGAEAVIKKLRGHSHFVEVAAADVENALGPVMSLGGAAAGATVAAGAGTATTVDTAALPAAEPQLAAAQPAAAAPSTDAELDDQAKAQAEALAQANAAG